MAVRGSMETFWDKNFQNPVTYVSIKATLKSYSVHANICLTQEASQFWWESHGHECEHSAVGFWAASFQLLF